MRKASFALLLSVLLSLLCGCAGGGERFAYDAPEHTHVFGSWYDVHAVTCQTEGEHTCLCKVCGQTYTEVVTISPDIDKRAHAFADTVTPPTEAQEGYTRRVCSLCGYVVERHGQRAALFALPLPEEPRVVIENAAQVAFSFQKDAQSGNMTVNTAIAANEADTAVSAQPALCLASALVAIEAVANEEITEETAVIITEQMSAGRNEPKFRVGSSFTVRELVKACVEDQSRVAVAALAACLEQDDNRFVDRLNARMSALGAKNTHFSGVFGTIGQTTVADSARLLWRVFYEDRAAKWIQPIFSLQELPCVAFYDSEGFLLYAVQNVSGAYYVCAVWAQALESGVENRLVAAFE